MNERENENTIDAAFIERLDRAISKVGGVKRISAKSGLSTGALYKYLRGESDPSRERLVRIAKATGTDLDWLATGAGGERVSVRHKTTVHIPRYDLRLSAGPGALPDRVAYIDDIPFTSEFIRKRLHRANVNGLMIFEAVGDSMLPTIADSDLVMADTKKTDLQDGLYAFTLGDEARIKRLRRLVSGIEIRSDNTELYPPEVLPAEASEQLQLLGRIVWIGRTV